MLLLWTLRYGPGGNLVVRADGKPYYFEDKVAAKATRNRLNGDGDGSKVGKATVVVAHGPDHDKYKAN